jgi:hypothetical protein
MSLNNPHSKEFGINLGKLLQQSVSDIDTCIVKLSQPHIHRATGPMFKIGKKIVAELNLTPATYQKNRRRTTTSLQNPVPAKRRATTSTVIQNDTPVAGNNDSHHVTVVPVPLVTSEQSANNQVENSSQSQVQGDFTRDSEYHRKKLMSAAVFNYFMKADDSEQEDLGINVDLELQQTWQRRIMENPNIKLDDVGDALLHALNEILCGGSNYKQLIPTNSSLHSNRTVVFTVLPALTYWIVLHCTWNIFELEDFGIYESQLENHVFRSPQTVRMIRNNLDSNLKVALSVMAGSDRYHSVDHIKMIVKQLKGYGSFTNEQAGAITQAAVTALKEICDESVGINSQVCDRHDKIQGSLYIQTNLVSGQKFQVLRSAGKHTNAILSCLEWMKEHAKRFVDTRTNVMTADEKIVFFLTLEELACSAHENRLEMIQLSDHVKAKLTAESPSLSDSSRKIIADLILIGMNKNQQHVKSVAVNYRKTVPRYASTVHSKRHN